MVKNTLLWLVVIGLLVVIFSGFEQSDKPTSLNYSEFVTAVDKNKVTKVEIDREQITGEKKDGSKFETVIPAVGDDELMPLLREHKVAITGAEPEKRGILIQLLIACFPILLIIGLFMFFMRGMNGGSGKGGRLGGPMSFGKSKAKMLTDEDIKVTFEDVAGCEESKEEVVEVVDFLKDPSKFTDLGATIPRGVLMVGPPGTGKTLLAKAIAGEAKVPFFSISGSDFVEMFVGVGASRVRDMFEQAKKNAPCIIFIDEIDAVGRKRGNGMTGGHDEREQTLNQLLVEMDGFAGNDGVIVIAATNRADVLDKALLRPGRFDRQVSVGLPDIKGREKILEVHMKKLPQTVGVDIASLAKGTPGFSGAQLANLVNEAALFAARHNKKHVDMNDFEEAKDKLYMGPARKSMVQREEERRSTAYHEAGHALVAELLPDTDPVYKVTIMPRGFALGVTWHLPEHDVTGYSKKWMLNKIAILFGGRIAEEVFIDQMSTGASDDFNKATSIARDMVTKYGMSDEMGVMVYEDDNDGYMPTRTISEATLLKIDNEIRRILDTQYKVARELIEANHSKMHAMADAMLKWETIDRDQLLDIMAGREPREPKEYQTPVIDVTKDTDSNDDGKKVVPPPLPVIS